MKKLICAVLALVLLFSFAGCGEKATEQKKVNENAIDVDLTVMNSTMVYNEVYNMLQNPQNYIGKTVKMGGIFGANTQNPQRNYYFCVIPDATACCSQGLEFLLRGKHEYPADYPQEGTNITVVGTFGTYKEGDQTYCQLENSTLAQN